MKKPSGRTRRELDFDTPLLEQEPGINEWMMNGWMDGWNGWIDGWMDGWMNECQLHAEFSWCFGVQLLNSLWRAHNIAFNSRRSRSHFSTWSREWTLDLIHCMKLDMNPIHLLLSDLAEFIDCLTRIITYGQQNRPRKSHVSATPGHLSEGWEPRTLTWMSTMITGLITSSV
jgi:hypothetical protein